VASEDNLIDGQRWPTREDDTACVDRDVGGFFDVGISSWLVQQELEENVEYLEREDEFDTVITPGRSPVRTTGISPFGQVRSWWKFFALRWLFNSCSPPC
jgi:hypothetical protein